MAYPDNLLVRGEHVIVNKRPHWKVLILPTILFIVIIGGGFALARSLSSWTYSSTANWVIVGVGVIALIVLVLVPFIRWRTEHFVITNHHVFFRTGLLSRREHQIPLGQIANMETEVTFWGRLMGYGSLIVESSADQPLKFRNVASLSKIQAALNQLIRDERERTHRGGGRGSADGDRGQDDQPPGGPQGLAQPHPTATYPPTGYPAQGYQQPPTGYPPQGYQQQGHPPQGYQQPPAGSAPQPGYPTEQGYPSQQGYPTQQAYDDRPSYPGQSGYPTQDGPDPQQGYPAQPGYQNPSGPPTGPIQVTPPASGAQQGSGRGEGRPAQQP